MSCVGRLQVFFPDDELFSEVETIAAVEVDLEGASAEVNGFALANTVASAEARGGGSTPSYNEQMDTFAASSLPSPAGAPQQAEAGSSVIVAGSIDPEETRVGVVSHLTSNIHRHLRLSPPSIDRCMRPT